MFIGRQYGELSPGVEAEHYFDFIVPLERLLIKENDSLPTRPLSAI